MLLNVFCLFIAPKGIKLKYSGYIPLRELQRSAGFCYNLKMLKGFKSFLIRYFSSLNILYYSILHKLYNLFLRLFKSRNRSFIEIFVRKIGKLGWFFYHRNLMFLKTLKHLFRNWWCLIVHVQDIGTNTFHRITFFKRWKKEYF